MILIATTRDKHRQIPTTVQEIRTLINNNIIMKQTIRFEQQTQFYRQNNRQLCKEGFLSKESETGSLKILG